MRVAQKALLGELIYCSLNLAYQQAGAVDFGFGVLHANQPKKELKPPAHSTSRFCSSYATFGALLCSIH